MSGGASAVRKGKTWEREVARLLREATPGCDARRGLSQSRGGGAETADVLHPALHVECKAGKRVDLRRALEQAVADSPAGKLAVVVARVDREPPMVVMRLDEWLQLIGEWWERGQR